jgi:predicted Zn-ribbon and HTH transcriptional regulator
MGWHSFLVGYDNVRKSPNDPFLVLTYAKCKWCGFEGQVDSQGNLF